MEQQKPRYQTDNIINLNSAEIIIHRKMIIIGGVAFQGMGIAYGVEGQFAAAAIGAAVGTPLVAVGCSKRLYKHSMNKLLGLIGSPNRFEAGS